MTDSQFNQLLDMVFVAIDGGLQSNEIVPSVIYELIENDDLQASWDALNYKEQDAVCYDLRDWVMDAVRENQQYLKSDEYMELQYTN